MKIILLVSSIYALASPGIWAIVFFKRMREKIDSRYAFFFFLSIWIIFMAVLADFNQLLDMSLVLNFFYPLCLVGSPILYLFFLYESSHEGKKTPKWAFYFFLIPLVQFVCSAYFFYVHVPFDLLKVHFYDIIFGRKDLLPLELKFPYFMNMLTTILFSIELVVTIIFSSYFIPQITRKSIQDSPLIGNRRISIFLFGLTILTILGIGTILMQILISYDATILWQISFELFWGTGWLVCGYFMFRLISVNPRSIYSFEEEWGNKESLEQTIYKHFENEHSYLDPTITLDKLAKDLKSNRTYVSNTFKERMGTNFNRFVNEYRVSYAKGLLLKQDGVKMNDVAHESGFNSYATFYRVFKEQTGVSPKEFMDQ